MSRRKIFKRFYRIIIALLLLLFLLLVTLYFAIQSKDFQNYMSEKITHSLSEKLGTEISIGNIEIEFFNNILLEDFFVADLNNDTLIHFNNANAKFSYVSLLGKSIHLDEINIDGLHINMHRHGIDSTFNFNFLLPKNKTEKSASNKEVWDVVLSKATLSNTQFNFEDSLTGMNLHSRIPELSVLMEEFNLAENKFDIKKLQLKEPIIDLVIAKKYKKNDKEFVLDIPAFLYAQHINIENAVFNMKNVNDSTTYHNMAFNDLKVKDINIDITNTYLWKDSVAINIVNLNLKEQSGFEIKKLATQASFNNRKVNLEKLSLQTNNSKINIEGNLKYRNFASFKNFNNKVRFNTKLSNTVINPEDLKYFIDTKNLGIGGVFKIEGDIKGKLSSLKAKNIKLSAGRRTKFEGNFSLNGLPNIKETFISFKMDRLVTDYHDLKFIHNKMPLPSNTKTLGTIVFKGRFDGFSTDFVTFGEASTALGNVNTDINFKINNSGIPAYSGKINVTDFEIGKWFGDETQLGAVTLNTEIKGKGVKIKTLDAVMNGDIKELTFKGYTYRDLKIDGSLKDKFFKGNATIHDEHLDLDFQGLVDATGTKPIFDFTAKLEHIDLLPLNLSNKDYKISAVLKSNFSASNIDDVLGNLDLENLEISLNDKTYHLNQLSIESEEHDNEQHLDIHADNFKVLVHGQYQISKLPEALKQVFNLSDSTNLAVQKLRFDAEITDETDLISLFVPKLKVPKKIIISGNLNTETKTILTSVNIPKVVFGKVEANDFISNIQVRNGEIDMINSLPELMVNDSLLIKDFSLIAKGFKEKVRFNLNSSNKNENTSIGLNGNLSFARRMFTVNLDTNSTILINNSFWNVAKGNSISFNKNVLIAENFKISNNKSEANFQVNKKGGTNNFILNLKNIVVEDFAEVLRNKGLDLKGELTGEIKIDNFDKEPAIHGNLDFVKIVLNDYNIGNFKLDSRVDIPDKKVYLSGGLFSKENHIDINGAYSIAKNSTKDDIDIDVNIKQFTVKSFEDFIPQFIHNSSGTLNGNVKVYGARKAPNLNGWVDVNDVTTTVSYTQVRYTIAQTKVLFEDNVIKLENGFTLQDQEGNMAYGSGRVTHENLKKWALDLKVVTDKIKALNTTLKDNDTFYGTAYLKGGASFTGLTTEPLIYLWGESEKDSYLDIPMTDNVKNKEYAFYQFVQSKKEIKEDAEKEEVQAVKIRGAKVKLDLNLDEDLELKIILDQDAGDVLKVQGAGDIKIDVGQGAEYVNFFGEYKVTKGDYLFTMQNVINKPFKIKNGSTINFNGNIYDDATVNMAATYTRKVVLYDFISEFISQDDADLINLARTRVPVSLYLDLTEKLSKPKITFDIGIDRVEPKLRSFVDSKLQTIKTNESEMNNQIFGVLVLTRFLPSFSALENSLGSNSSDAVINTVSELLSTQLSRHLTDLTSNIVKDLDIFVNFSTYDQGTIADETLRKRRELQLALTKRFLNDRLSVNIGGNFDFGENYSPDGNRSTSTFFGANVSFDYAFTKNRRWSAKAFTVSDYDSFSENNRSTRSGLGLSYKREFDDIYDLFNIKRKEKIKSIKN